jgi:hypothetical protein
MIKYLATPRFGAPRNTPEYYAAVNNIVKLLKPAATLATIATALNAASFTTPTGKEWNRKRVSDYLRTAI